MGGYQNEERFDWGKNQETQVDTAIVEKVSRASASASAAQQEKRERIRLAVGQNERVFQRGHHAHEAHRAVCCGQRHGAYRRRRSAVAGETALSRYRTHIVIKCIGNVFDAVNYDTATNIFCFLGGPRQDTNVIIFPNRQSAREPCPTVGSCMKVWARPQNHPLCRRDAARGTIGVSGTRNQCT